LWLKGGDMLLHNLGGRRAVGLRLTEVLHLGAAASAVACLPAPLATLALCLLVGFMLLPNGCRSGYCPLVSPTLDFAISALISLTVLFQLQ